MANTVVKKENKDSGLQKELDAIANIVRALEKLPDADKIRILNSVSVFYDLDIKFEN